jgi:putative phosphoribosyl transferase
MNDDLFRDRTEAGQRLAEQLLDYANRNAIVLAIPRGGVPVGYEIAKRLNAEFDVIVPRKMPIPWNPEAGFGAITADGTIVLNQPMVESLGLTQEDIQKVAEEVKAEVIRRTKVYRGDKPPPNVEGRPVLLVDDGLASGYTMLAAIESVRKLSPAEVVVAVPVASTSAARIVRQAADKLVAIIISSHLPFAVADFYLEWRDLTDEEVLSYLQKK